MDIQAEERRRAFLVWLRTGRVTSLQQAGAVEFKFNPWHDPANGRFTFANSWRYVGGFGRTPYRGGGGEGFGGGGASGSWSGPNRPAENRTRQRSDQASSRHVAPSKSIPARAAGVETIDAVQFSAADTFRRIERNGYEYQIDSDDRTRRVSGPLTLSAGQPRSRRVQALAGGDDRRSSDDGGHYIARRFNGPAEVFNHFAQDANFNRGGYRLLEDQWARAKRGGHRVSVKIVPVYQNRSQRPSAINIWFWIDGFEESQHFPNERKDGRHGK